MLRRKLKIQKREYRDGIKSKDTRLGYGDVCKACACQGGVLSQYVHIGYITQAIIAAYMLHLQILICIVRHFSSPQ